MMRWLLSLLGLCPLLAACETGPARLPDAAVDRAMPGEGLPLPSETRPRRIIDFVVQGCAERSADRCSGSVPLNLTFAAVLEGELQGLSWDFGDGSPAQLGEVVSHIYSVPGSFTVTLGAVVSGQPVTEQKSDFVEARPAGPGAACSSNQACASGTCLCYESCPFPLSEGLCVQECGSLPCQLSGTTCIDLSVAGVSSAPSWRGRICLPTCSEDGECRPNFPCALAPAAAGWVKACVPPSLRFVGEPCRGETGEPDPLLCLGGLCLDIGASGYCSAPCAAADCPLGTRCARLGPGGPAVCLLRCGPSSCESDPRLACELPGASGQFGFEIIGPADAAGTRYCAPKRCLLDSECGLGGKCDLGSGGFCSGL